MKKLFLLIAAACVTMSVGADMLIGKCRFYGQQPPHCLNTGQTIVYYYEMSSSAINRGGTLYQQCTGDVWVIYRAASEPQRIQFQTSSGFVQVCNDF